ncbi:MAG: caspase family protein [candidate division KSB1 bacterium]|nr:caspase family protein [candidate division KSB1 bacterium]MDZ7303791.1 caspase family protein [candidate division KSB1 bacterium]MDZ7313050.1 caspase family protein [candidate division KSB1 bacterium]
MRRALVVGIDHYQPNPLMGCVNDAKQMAALLSKNQDGSPNFSCKNLLSSESKITRALLRENLQELFGHQAEVVLFYFAGHGTLTKFGGYLVTQDYRENDEGVAMLDVLSLANQSNIDEVVIILDCCHSGALGLIPALQSAQVHLREGVSILCASRATQPAVEKDGGGIFTTLICGALDGGAADVTGAVTVAGLYAFVDQALGAWEQRPLFKSHVSRLLPLRKCHPVVELPILRRLPEYFPMADFEYPLDPSFEPTAPEADKHHTDIFAHLQKYRDARLLVPVQEKHLYYAAMHSKACKLTPLGQFYWKLAHEGKI